MKEVWKDIDGYEGLYQISNLGNVKSLPRKKTIKQERILKPKLNKNGYLEVALCKNSNYKMCRVHKLVAKSFLNNPKNKTQVNHKNGIKIDNEVSNLEYCTPSENIRHAWDNGFKYISDTQRKRISNLNKGKPSINRKKVDQYDLNGNFIKTWDYISEAEKVTGIRTQNICACLKGKQKQTHNYIWKYHKDTI